MIRNINPISAYNSTIYNAQNTSMQAFCGQARFVCKNAEVYRFRAKRGFLDQCRDFCTAMSMRKSPIDVKGKTGSVNGNKEEYIILCNENFDKTFKELAEKFAEEHKLEVKFETEV